MHDYSTIVGHVVLFLTYVVGQVFTSWREARRHRWTREQFGQLRTEVRNGHTNGDSCKA